MSKPWRIELLGKLQVLHGDSSYSHFETRKTAALLAYLALTLPKSSSREQLAEMLWPEEDPEVTRTRLRQSLAALRRVLEPAGGDTATAAVIVADRASIRLNPEAVTTDVAEFESLLRSARKADSTDARREGLQGAVDLYQGDLLPSFYEDFVLDARRRLSEAYCGALAELAPLLTQAGDHTSAVAIAKQAVIADPSDETTHLCVIRACAAAGRLSDALKQAREMERALRQEWDTAPSEEARALVASLRAVPAAAPTGASRPLAPALESDPTSSLITDNAPLRFSPADPPTQQPEPRRVNRHTLVIVLGAALLLAGIAVWRGRTPRPVLAALDRRIVAVLPFDISGSDGARDAYFADGLTEEMTNTLGKIGALTVIGRMSSARIKENLSSGGSLARDLNVGTLITGHISKETSRLRVTVEAVDARTQRVIWSEEYDKAYRPSEVLEIERDVAQRVARSLRVRLSGSEQDKIARKPTDNFAAYDCYLRGRYLWNQRSEDSLKRAITFFDRAIQLDPHYAPAYVGEADAYDVLGYYGYIDSATASRKAQFAAGKALEEAVGDDATLAAAYTSRAWEKMVYQHDWPGAETDFQKAVQLSPDYATAHQWRSLHLMLQGHERESMDEIDVALKRDPLSFIIETSQGGRYYHAGLYDHALRRYDDVLNLNPSYTIAYFWRALAREKSGMRPAAQNDLLKAVTNSHRATLFLAFLAKNYAESGQRAQALAIREELRRRAAREYVSPFCMAVIEVGLGDKNQAFLLLQKAYETHDGALTFFGEASPAFASLKSDPRYGAIRRQMGLPPLTNAP
jgi:DNA-binding SARP family transcriptional activator/TolB-like protein/Tfp pilus assembly protein PilF